MEEQELLTLMAFADQVCQMASGNFELPCVNLSDRQLY
jgi:hypothetical protein